jgi:hypothetical protein
MHDVVCPCMAGALNEIIEKRIYQYKLPQEKKLISVERLLHIEKFNRCWEPQSG